MINLVDQLVAKLWFTKANSVPKYKGPSNIDHREQRSYMCTMYLTQDTSRMVAAKVKQE